MSTVTRPAIGFKFGTYPRKNFACTREEFVRINGRAGTVPVGLCPRTRDHYVGEPNDLDGITGTASFAVDDAGDLLPLTLDLPDWVSGLVDAKGYKLSAVFDNATDKRLLKFDFVRSPAVPEAVIFSDGHRAEAAIAVAFADDPAPEPEGDEEGDDHDAYQRMHEILAATFPRACDPAFAPKGPAEAALLDLHDECVANGAHCDGPHAADDAAQPNPNPTTTPKPKGAVAMSADIATFSEEQLDEMDPAVAAVVRQAQVDRVKFSDAERQLRKLTEDAIAAEAVAFSIGLSSGENVKATPAEAKAAARLYRVAARLDRERDKPVLFAEDGKETSANLTDLIRAVYEARPSSPKNANVAGATFSLGAEPNEDEAKAAAAEREREKRENQDWQLRRQGNK